MPVGPAPGKGTEAEGLCFQRPPTTETNFSTKPALVAKASQQALTHQTPNKKPTNQQNKQTNSPHLSSAKWIPQHRTQLTTLLYYLSLTCPMFLRHSSSKWEAVLHLVSFTVFPQHPVTHWLIRALIFGTAFVPNWNLTHFLHYKRWFGNRFPIEAHGLALSLMFIKHRFVNTAPT